MNMKSIINCITNALPPLSRIGYYISLLGIVVIMLWIGFFKFTPTEAAGIKPLVENHFLLFWLYNVMDVQQVSNLFGVIEIITGLLLLFSLKYDVKTICRSLFDSDISYNIQFSVHYSRHVECGGWSINH